MGPGFDLTQTLRAEVNLPSDRYRTPERLSAYVERALPELQAIPGISNAAAARIIPFTDSSRFTSDITLPDTHEKFTAHFSWNAVSPDFFSAMGIPILRGRAFTAADRAGENVVIVNRTFMERYLGDRAAIGLTFLWGRDGTETFRIVGVSASTKTMTVGEDDVPQLYQPLAQIPNDRRRSIRAALGDAPANTLPRSERTLRRIEPAAGTLLSRCTRASARIPSQPGRCRALRCHRPADAGPGRRRPLRDDGVSVARQTQENGIRLAIGATRSDIARMVLRDAVTLVVISSVVGLGLALFVMRPLAMFLVGSLTPANPLSLGAVVLVLLVTALPPPRVRVRRAACFLSTGAMTAEPRVSPVVGIHMAGCYG